METLEAEAQLEEDEEESGVMDSTLAHLERVLAETTKYLGTRTKK